MRTLSTLCRVVALVLCWTTAVGHCEELPCANQGQSDTVVGVSSVRNQTGHWIAKVLLRLKSSTRSSTVPWSVDVEPSTSTCEDTSTFQLILTFTASPARAKDYELFPGLGHYKFHEEAVTWTAARRRCEQEGGHLMIINSEHEAQLVVHLFTRHPGVTLNWAWVGLYRPVASLGWITVFGQPMNATGYGRWHPTRPGKEPAHDYMLSYRTDGSYHDNPNLNKYPFICEQP